MSDRDFFAAVAMHALVLGSETYRNSPVAAKERAFLIADQMVRGQKAEPEQPKPEGQ
jgi:hypothetical protein